MHSHSTLVEKSLRYCATDQLLFLFLFKKQNTRIFSLTMYTNLSNVFHPQFHLDAKWSDRNVFNICCYIYFSRFCVTLWLVRHIMYAFRFYTERKHKVLFRNNDMFNKTIFRYHKTLKISKSYYDSAKMHCIMYSKKTFKLFCICAKTKAKTIWVFV